MAKEDADALKKFPNKPEKVITVITRLSKETSQNKNYLSDSSGLRKSSKRNSKPFENNDAPTLERSCLFSRTSRDNGMQKQTSKVSQKSDESGHQASRSRNRNEVANNRSDSDRVLLKNKSRISKKVSSNSSFNADPTSRTCMDATSLKPNSRTLQKSGSAKTSIDLAPLTSNSAFLQNKFENDTGKKAVHRSSSTKTLKPSVDESVDKRTSKAERNFSTSQSKTRSRSESINNSTEPRSEANNQQTQLPSTADVSATSTRSPKPSVDESVDNRTNEVKQNSSTSRPKTRSRSESINNSTERRSEANNRQTQQPPTTDVSTYAKPSAKPVMNNLQPNQRTKNNNHSNASIINQPAPTVYVCPSSGEQPNTPNDNELSLRTNHDYEHSTTLSEKQLNPEANIRQSWCETRTQPIPADPNSANAAKQKLEEWLQSTALKNNTPQPRKSPVTSPFSEFPVIRPCDKDITNDPEDCKRKLEQKLDRMFKLKKAYYADPSDDLPFIDLAYTKEGVFVDEPVERAFVFDEDFLKEEENQSLFNPVPVPRGCRCDQSRSASFPHVGLNAKSDTVSSSFSSQKFANEKSSHTKWMDEKFEEAEINMIENVLYEFHRKFKKLVAGVRMISSSSETSSMRQPDYSSEETIIIPNRSPR